MVRRRKILKKEKTSILRKLRVSLQRRIYLRAGRERMKPKKT
jgi:hypothetical protein